MGACDPEDPGIATCGANATRFPLSVPHHKRPRPTKEHLALMNLQRPTTRWLMGRAMASCPKHASKAYTRRPKKSVNPRPLAIDRTRARTQTSGNAHPIPTIYQTQFLDRPQMLAQPMSARVTHRGTRITMSHIPLRRTCSLGPQTGSARRGSPKRRRQKKHEKML